MQVKDNKNVKISQLNLRFHQRASNNYVKITQWQSEKVKRLLFVQDGTFKIYSGWLILNKGIIFLN